MDESNRGGSAAKATEGKPSQGEDAPVMPGQMATQGEPVATALTDSEITRIADIVNTAEIEQAMVAKQKVLAPKIREFAEQMIADHRKAKENGAKLAEREGIIPDDSATATEVAESASDVREQLQNTKAGEGFDRLYLDTQMREHRRVLDLLDSRLIPNAKNERLEMELLRTRQMVEHHLTEARNLALTY